MVGLVENKEFSTELAQKNRCFPKKMFSVGPNILVKLTNTDTVNEFCAIPPYI